MTVIGGESDPDQRTTMLARFSPRTVVRPDYEPPDGEVDLLLSTDVLSEGQNLQRAYEEGEATRIRALPWGIGAVVRPRAGARARRPGVFFATRTRPMTGAPEGCRYWRLIESDPAEGNGVVTSDLEMLRRIDPAVILPASCAGWSCWPLDPARHRGHA